MAVFKLENNLTSYSDTILKGLCWRIAMFNPSELEGEVDHSFFDSDGADGSGDGGKKMEKGLEAEKESPAAHERLQTKLTENTKRDVTPKSDKTRKHLKQLDKIKKSRAEKKERSKASSVSSVSCTSDKVVSDSSDSEAYFNLRSKRPNGTFMALLAETSEVYDKDENSHSPNETEEEASAFSASSKRRNKQSPQKRIRNRHTRTPSPTSTESSSDADSERSGSSSSRRSSLESPTIPKPNKFSLSPGADLAGSQDLSTTCTDETDSTVTDVSPLSSPDTSPLQSVNLNHTRLEEESQKGQQEERVPSSGLSHMHQDEDSDQDVDECSLRLESHFGSKLALHCPGGGNRKNYSFTNDEVRRIDQENQRLLRELSRISPGPTPGSAVGRKSHVASNAPLTRLSHSALNRHREQQRIERENMAFLKRLESVKPTPGLKRSDQLADYQRQVGYLGAPSYPICWSITKKERPTSRTPSGARLVSSRAAFTSTGSSSTPVPRSENLSAARPAWC
ncbi:cilia- and flagella-associated protein 97 isoform X2 [Embiotoca jacksoni]|uniref:cilia- and flagella-associated protein 97 isoform X2 n=1 Tax=Embiotoca jacksoni TaxID=100190 RepID=UPI00370387B3